MAIVLNCMHLGIGPHEPRSVLVIATAISSLIAEGRFFRVTPKHLPSFGPCVMVRVFVELKAPYTRESRVHVRCDFE